MKRTARLAAVCAALLFVLPAPIPASAEKEIQNYATSGTCGDNIEWRVEGEVLYLTGSGDMWDFDSGLDYCDPEILRYVRRCEMDDAITSIGNCAFSAMTLCNEYRLPSQLKYIGDSAFLCNSCLTEITLPDGLEEIGANAFLGAGLQRAEIPASVRRIDDYAFSSMESLEEVILHDGLEFVGTYCFAFDRCLRDCDIPKTVTDLGDAVFSDTPLWCFCAERSMGDFIIIGDGWLYSYTGTDTDVIVPDTVKHLCRDAFTRMTFEKSPRETDEMPDYYDYIFFPDVKTVTLPDTVVSITENNFSNLERLERVVLSESITDIPRFAFAECRELESVQLPQKLRTIGTGAFMNCINLTDINLPDTLEDVDSYALENTAWLRAQKDFVILGDGLLYRYQGYDKVVTVPEGVKRIGDSGLEGNFTELYLPDSLQIIESFGIHSSSLVHIDFGEGVREIQQTAVRGSESLTAVRIPDSVTELAEGAFSSCAIKTIVGNPEGAAGAFASSCNLPVSDSMPEYIPGSDQTPDAKYFWTFANSGTVFGEKNYLPDADREALLKYLPASRKEISEEWGGSCFGMGITALLAIDGRLNPAALQPGARSVSELKPTPEVLSFINFYHQLQYTDVYSSISDRETVYQKLRRAFVTASHIKDGEKPFMMTFLTPDFGHAVIVTGHETGKWQFGDEVYDGRILFWDPNYPNDLPNDDCLYYNSINYSYAIPYYDLFCSGKGGEQRGKLLNVYDDISLAEKYQYPYPEVQIIRGDVNGDGYRDVKDAVMLARYVGQDDGVQLDERGETAAELDGQPGLSTDDLTTLLRVLAGLIDLAA